MENERTGLLREADPDDFAKAISLLETDTVDATKLGATGRRRAEREFSVERMLERTVGVYQQVAQRSGTGPKVLRVYHSAVMPAWRTPKEWPPIRSRLHPMRPRSWRRIR